MTEEPFRPKSLNEMFWWSALAEAQAGQPDELTALLRDPEATPTAEAREYLASIIEGSQRPPVRDTRTKLPPRRLAQMRVVIAALEDGKAFGHLPLHQYKRQKDALIAEISSDTGAKPIVVKKRWNELATVEEKRAKELVAWVRQHRKPPPQRTIYRMGKIVKVES